MFYYSAVMKSRSLSASSKGRTSGKEGNNSSRCSVEEAVDGKQDDTVSSNDLNAVSASSSGLKPAAKKRRITDINSLLLLRQQEQENDRLKSILLLVVNSLIYTTVFRFWLTIVFGIPLALKS